MQTFYYSDRDLQKFIPQRDSSLIVFTNQAICAHHPLIS